jgi:hypothetical protein
MQKYPPDFSGRLSPPSYENTLQELLCYPLGQQVKYSGLSEEFTGPTNKKAFELLSLARVVSKSYS